VERLRGECVDSVVCVCVFFIDNMCACVCVCACVLLVYNDCEADS